MYQLTDVFLFAPQKTVDQVDQLLGARGVGRGMFGGWAGPKLRSHLAKLIWDHWGDYHEHGRYLLANTGLKKNRQSIFTNIGDIENHFVSIGQD